MEFKPMTFSPQEPTIPQCHEMIQSAVLTLIKHVQPWTNIPSKYERNHRLILFFRRFFTSYNMKDRTLAINYFNIFKHYGYIIYILPQKVNGLVVWSKSSPCW